MSEVRLLRFGKSGNPAVNDTISKCGERNSLGCRVEVYGVR